MKKGGVLCLNKNKNGVEAFSAWFNGSVRWRNKWGSDMFEGRGGNLGDEQGQITSREAEAGELDEDLKL